MKILYISRKYPPSVGGMEKMNFFLVKELSKKAQVDKIVWGRSQFFLPLFLTATSLRLLWRKILRRKYDVVILGDALLAPLGVLCKKLMGVPVLSIAHGLDITYGSVIYQKMVIPALSGLDRVICVSEKTREECIKRGIKESNLKVIPNGIGEVTVEENRGYFLSEMEKLNISVFENTKILLTVGRLIKRKGVVWFIENVFKNLLESNPEAIYIVVGDGREKERILSKVAELGFENNVFLTGRVNEKLLANLYAFSSLFIMPNIHVPGDMEGFGIVALEAASYGLPAVASDLEGIKDSVSNGVSGTLVSPERPDLFEEEIIRLLRNKTLRSKLSEEAVSFAHRFSWKEIAGEYLTEIKGVIKE